MQKINFNMWLFNWKPSLIPPDWWCSPSTWITDVLMLSAGLNSRTWHSGWNSLCWESALSHGLEFKAEMRITEKITKNIFPKALCIVSKAQLERAVQFPSGPGLKAFKHFLNIKRAISSKSFYCLFLKEKRLQDSEEKICCYPFYTAPLPALSWCR